MDPDDIMAARYLINHKIYDLPPETGTETMSVDRRQITFICSETIHEWVSLCPFTHHGVT